MSQCIFPALVDLFFFVVSSLSKRGCMGATVTPKIGRTGGVAGGLPWRWGGVGTQRTECTQQCVLLSFDFLDDL